LHELLSVLNDVRAHAWPSAAGGLGDTTLNVGLNNGGQAVHALAEHASADLLFCAVAPPAELLKRVQAFCAAAVDVRCELVTMNDPVDMSYVDALVSGYPTGVAAFNTDIPYLDLGGGKAVLYGHGDIADAHCEREHITLKDLRALPAAYEDIARQLLSKSG
jgi:acetylornithine deacetylase/succinyl-diaminopimelate desuccinylase-like protein